MQSPPSKLLYQSCVGVILVDLIESHLETVHDKQVGNVRVQPTQQHKDKTQTSFSLEYAQNVVLRTF